MGRPRPDLGLTCHTLAGDSPRLGHSRLKDNGPAMTLPVTFDSLVAAGRDVFSIVFGFHCGRTQAKATNALLGDPLGSLRSLLAGGVGGVEPGL
jgi:hypothetical protein